MHPRRLHGDSTHLSFSLVLAVQRGTASLVTFSRAVGTPARSTMGGTPAVRLPILTRPAPIPRSGASGASNTANPGPTRTTGCCTGGRPTRVDRDYSLSPARLMGVEDRYPVRTPDHHAATMGQAGHTHPITDTSPQLLIAVRSGPTTSKSCERGIGPLDWDVPVNPTHKDGASSMAGDAVHLLF